MGILYGILAAKAALRRQDMAATMPRKFISVFMPSCYHLTYYQEMKPVFQSC